MFLDFILNPFQWRFKTHDTGESGTSRKDQTFQAGFSRFCGLTKPYWHSDSFSFKQKFRGMKLWKLKKSQERPLLATQILSKFQSEHGRMTVRERKSALPGFQGTFVLSYLIVATRYSYLLNLRWDLPQVCCDRLGLIFGLVPNFLIAKSSISRLR